MRYLKIILLAFMAIIAAPMGVAQSLADERLNPIECLRAVEDLPKTFRTHLQIQCLSIPGEICVKREGGAGCIQDTTAHLIEFYQSLRPRLPETITARGFGARSYARALNRIDAVFDTGPECDHAADPGMCAYLAYGANIIDLIYRARQAEVPWP